MTTKKGRNKIESIATTYACFDVYFHQKYLREPNFLIEPTFLLIFLTFADQEM